LANESESQKRVPPPQLGGMAVPPQYTQVNILFPATQVELPPAEKFNAFPPEAQKAIIDAFKTEQLQRHTWLRNQQHNDHQLNTLSQKNYFTWRMGGLICATVLHWRFSLSARFWFCLAHPQLVWRHWLQQLLDWWEQPSTAIML
jgi:hypothetical protein